MTTLTFGDLRLDGTSIAGEETWFRVEPPGLAFDVGRGASELAGIRDLAISHGHLDHALGVPYALSQSRRHHLPGRRVLAPRLLVPHLEALIRATEGMEGVPYDVELVAMDPGAKVELGRGFLLEAFATEHVVPSLGYHLLERKRRLLPALRGLPTEEIAARARRGEVVDEEVLDLRLTYCGDTSAGIFAREPRLFLARVLLLECTFMTAEHRDKGARFGHLHLEDIARVAARFENEAIVLHHISRRYRPADVRRAVAEHLPGLTSRLHLVLEGG